MQLIQPRLCLTIYIGSAFIVLADSIISLTRNDLYPLIMFLAVALPFARLRVPLQYSIKVTASLSVLNAAMLLLPVHSAVLLSAVIIMYASTSVTKPPIIHIFNLANTMLPTYLAGIFLQTLRVHISSAISWEMALVFMCALAIRYLANSIPMGVWVAYHSHRPLAAVLMELWSSDGYAGMGQRLLVIVIAFIYPFDPVLSLLLLSGIVYFLHYAAQIYSQRQLLTRMAQSDRLTEVGNRHAWHELVDHFMQVPDPPYLIIVSDLNGLKEVNDLYGHDMGDQVLKSFARHLATAVGEKQVFRFGGDEFAALLPGHTPEKAGAIQNKIDQAAQAFSAEWLARHIDVSASFGIATAVTTDDITKTLRTADLAMYDEKRRLAASEQTLSGLAPQ